MNQKAQSRNRIRLRQCVFSCSQSLWWESADVPDIITMFQTGFKTLLSVIQQTKKAVESRALERVSSKLILWMARSVKTEKNDSTSHSRALPGLDQSTLGGLKRGMRGSSIKHLSTACSGSCCRLTLPLGGGKYGGNIRRLVIPILTQMLDWGERVACCWRRKRR